MNFIADNFIALSSIIIGLFFLPSKNRRKWDQLLTKQNPNRYIPIKYAWFIQYPYAAMSLIFIGILLLCIHLVLLK